MCLRLRVSFLALSVAPAVAAFTGAAENAALPDYENPRALHRGAERPHASTMIFPDAASAAKATRREQSPFYLSLNGDWDYHWPPKPTDMPDGFGKAEFSIAG